MSKLDIFIYFIRFSDTTEAVLPFEFGVTSSILPPMPTRAQTPTGVPAGTEDAPRLQMITGDGASSSNSRPTEQNASGRAFERLTAASVRKGDGLNDPIRSKSSTKGSFRVRNDRNRLHLGSDKTPEQGPPKRDGRPLAETRRNPLKKSAKMLRFSRHFPGQKNHTGALFPGEGKGEPAVSPSSGSVNRDGQRREIAAVDGFRRSLIGDASKGTFAREDKATHSETLAGKEKAEPLQGERGRANLRQESLLQKGHFEERKDSSSPSMASPRQIHVFRSV